MEPEKELRMAMAHLKRAEGQLGMTGVAQGSCLLRELLDGAMDHISDLEAELREGRIEELKKAQGGCGPMGPLKGRKVKPLDAAKGIRKVRKPLAAMKG